MTEDGRPIRSIVTGRRRIVTGSYASRKSGRAQVFESMNEHAHFMHCEVDPWIVEYRAQPFRLEMVLGGRKRIYIADCVRLTAAGAVEVVEVKGDAKSLREPDYAAKLERVGQLCELVGWSFVTLTRQQIVEPQARHRNVEIVQQQRMTHFDERHVYEVQNHLERCGGCAELDDLAGRLGHPTVGRSIVGAMMVARIVAIDLTEKLGPSSVVGAMNDAHEWGVLS
ncbi:hypothetical protein D3C86_1514280 [compost metagenome]